MGEFLFIYFLGGKGGGGGGVLSKQILKQFAKGSVETVYFLGVSLLGN